MRKTLLITVAIVACLSLSVPMVLAQPNQSAIENADDNAVFNRVGDWLATIGKSDEEKVRIKAERKAERTAKRAKKAMKKTKDGLSNKMKGSKKGSY